MRLIHTADWHLGHTLHGLSRRAEHLAFLSWLLTRMEALQADALLVAGDIFDTANPSAEAQSDFYKFLIDARRRLPQLDVVVTGGNHDSAARLDAPVPLLSELGIHVVGGLARKSDGALDYRRLVIPLTNQAGDVAAHVVAIPFLRPADLPSIDDEGVDVLIEGVRRVYAEAIAHAAHQRLPGQALLAMGHLYMTGSSLSEMSERKILGGNQHALPVDIFPDSLAYVALGHLHLAQAVGRDSVRYSGSPIPLSMTELHYKHQVSVIDLEGEELKACSSELIPRHVQLLRVPSEPQQIEAVEEELKALTSYAHLPLEERPILEVPVSLEQPEPGLRTRVEQALEGRGLRLARIVTHTTGDGRTLAQAVPQAALSDLQPEDVFRKRWSRDHKAELPLELLSAFHELIDAASRGPEDA